MICKSVFLGETEKPQIFVVVIVIQMRASNVKNKLPLSRNAVQRLRTQMLEPESWVQIPVLPVCACACAKCMHMCAYICACVCGCVWASC